MQEEMKIFNTLSRKKEGFEPIKKGEVGLYSCGPTVYSYQHIGNLRTYIFNDLLKRTLLLNKFKVKHVMNYTDVGHLTSDADEGEDKMEKAALKEKKTPLEIAAYYAKVFETDCEKLNILPPDIVCKATEHIKEQINLIRVLEEKGYTYKTRDGVYFDTSKVPDYGTLGRLDVEGMQAGRRVDIGEKKNKTDFALWKLSDKPGVRKQEWDSPWGIGFPGWHLECSAMATKYLGEQFDIHTGGEDHIQVHHTNEIAQSESASRKKPWVKYWMHGAFLTFKGEKVSKSKGGLYTVSELEEKGFDPLDFRYLCLNTHYRKQLNFSLDVLDGAKNSFDRLKNVIVDLKSKNDSKYGANDHEKKFIESVNDDINTPQALSFLWDVLRNPELGSKEKLKLAYRFDEVLGLGIREMKEQKFEVDKEVETLIREREEARKNKDFSKADRIRNQLKGKGIRLLDTPGGVQWKKV